MMHEGGIHGLVPSLVPVVACFEWMSSTQVEGEEQVLGCVLSQALAVSWLSPGCLLAVSWLSPGCSSHFWRCPVSAASLVRAFTAGTLSQQYFCKTQNVGLKLMKQ